jgi:hypothetical protein
MTTNSNDKDLITIEALKVGSELDNAIRGWIVMSQFEQDQSYYQKLKEQYE